MYKDHYESDKCFSALESGISNLESTLARSQSEIGNVSLSRLICHATFSANH